mgnify:CR=1 FL=1|tara:strand:- start:666 stop:2084 length:1419 start_codon:yes stop_codon:yes gene_type:complete
MGQCKLHLYDHFNYQGHLATFTNSAYHGHHNSNDRDASGKVTGNCKNTTWLGFEHPGESGHAWIIGEGGSLSNFRDSHDKCNVKDRPIWNFHDQNNSIKKIDIPTENINEGRMREDITIYAKRRDTRQCQWATYPHITKTSDGKYNAADNDQWLVGHNDKKGKACPGGDAYWKGYRKIACVYDVKTGSKLGRIQTLHSEIKDTFAGDPRKGMFENIVNKYCDRADRLDDRIKSGGGVNTCRSVANAKEFAKVHCKQGDRIKSDKTFCTVEELGQDLYDELATDYCEKNPSTDWCSCYNVMKHKDDCRNHADLPGCEDVADQLNMMADSLPADAMSEFKGNEICWGSCVGTDRYIPHKDKLDPTGRCNREVCINVANITAGNLTDSGINLDMSCVTGDGGGTGGSGTSESSSGGGGLKRSDTEAGVITDTKTAESIMNRERFYEKSSFKWGGGAAVSSSSCLICLITIVVLFL